MARVSDSRLRAPGFEFCTAVYIILMTSYAPISSKIKLSGQVVFTLHCSSSLSCTNECLAIDGGGYVYINNLRALIAAWLDASQRRRDGLSNTKL